MDIKQLEDEIYKLDEHCTELYNNSTRDTSTGALIAKSNVYVALSILTLAKTVETSKLKDSLKDIQSNKFKIDVLDISDLK